MLKIESYRAWLTCGTLEAATRSPCTVLDVLALRKDACACVCAGLWILKIVLNMFLKMFPMALQKHKVILHLHVFLS